jgi:hypothetical protein
VKLLLLGMVQRGTGVAVLEADSPLPPATHFGVQLPRFDLVADAIKLMAGVEPGPAPQPREGVIDLQVIHRPEAGPRLFQVFARFVDAPQRTVYLHLAKVVTGAVGEAEAPVGA